MDDFRNVRDADRKRFGKCSHGDRSGRVTLSYFKNVFFGQLRQRVIFSDHRSADRPSSRNMPPLFSTDYPVNRCGRDSELNRNIWAAKFFVFVNLSYLKHLFFRQFALDVFLSFPIWKSSLVNSVLNIVGSRSGEKMIRVTARRIVATVAHAQAAFNTAVRQNIGNAVSLKYLFADYEVAVSSWVSPVHPRPAFAVYTFANLAPKRLLNFLGKFLTVDLHNQFVGCAAPLAGSTAQRYFDFPGQIFHRTKLKGQAL